MSPPSNKVSDLIAEQRLVAILRLDDLSHAVQLSRALLAAGIKVQEYTLSNPNALVAVKQVIDEIPEFRSGEATIGIGSVRRIDQVSQAIEAGAQFVVTPVLVEGVVEACLSNKLPVFPGAFTPTEIARAWDLGATAVKVFPARSLGPTYIKDLLAPMPELRLLPTGGINLDNMPDYLAAGAHGVGVGGNLFQVSDVMKENWGQVTQSARAFVEQMQQRNGR